MKAEIPHKATKLNPLNQQQNSKIKNKYLNEYQLNTPIKNVKFSKFAEVDTGGNIKIINRHGC